MKKIDAYETSDGKIFTNVKEAMTHEDMLTFITWYGSGHENRIHDSDRGYTVPPALAYFWVMNHKDYLLEYLGDCQVGMWPAKSCMLYPVEQKCQQQPIAPNPSPGRWTLLKLLEFNNAYLMKVMYHDCTNYEGVKIMVYKGEYVERSELDPHFSETGIAPVARFAPTNEGMMLATKLAGSL